MASPHNLRYGNFMLLIQKLEHLLVVFKLIEEYMAPDSDKMAFDASLTQTDLAGFEVYGQHSKIIAYAIKVWNREYPMERKTLQGLISDMHGTVNQIRQIINSDYEYLTQTLTYDWMGDFDRVRESLECHEPRMMRLMQDSNDVSMGLDSFKRPGSVVFVDETAKRQCV